VSGYGRLDYSVGMYYTCDVIIFKIILAMSVTTDPDAGTSAVRSSITFWSGSEAYNVWMFLFSSIAIVGGVIAIIVAISQIGRIAKAAEAASQATEKTHQEMTRWQLMNAIAQARQHIDRTSDAIKFGKFSTAEIRCEESNSAVATLRSSTSIRIHLKKKEWDELSQTIMTVAKILDGIRIGNIQEDDPNVQSAPELLRKASLMLVSISIALGEQTGASNG